MNMKGKRLQMSVNTYQLKNINNINILYYKIYICIPVYSIFSLFYLMGVFKVLSI